MKRLVLSFFAILFLSMAAVQAQAPLKISYQMVVRDDQNNLVTSRLVHIKYSIFRQSVNGELVYSEHSSAVTDRSGWMSSNIGEGVVLFGSMATIDWSDGPFMLKCDVDPKGGNNYSVSTVQQMVSVPYSLFAASADYERLVNKPVLQDSIKAFLADTASQIPLMPTPTIADVLAAGSQASGRQIKGILNPTDDQDVVTLAFLRQYIDSLIVNGIVGTSQNQTTYSIVRENKRVVVNTNRATAGALHGLFSVSPSQQVRFSQGNLQYSSNGTHAVVDGTQAAGVWRFATRQYDHVGSDEGTKDGTWSDLLDWNSSGSAASPELGATAQDWGFYNAISNGGNKPSQWRTLSMSEWNYLRTQRRDAAHKYALATIGGVYCGIVFLPDTWQLPQECKFTAGQVRGYQTNAYTFDEWAMMQDAGAVFLPAGGSRSGKHLSKVGTFGSYWSSTSDDTSSAYSFDFSPSGMQTTGNHRMLGQSVRLVQNN